MVMDDGKTEATVNESTLKIALSNTGPTKEISLVRVDGVIDTMTAGELERVISSLTARGRYRLILDLAGVEYISSAGWGIFVSHLREIREHAGDIKLARMTPEVYEIYELLEFDGLLPSFNALEPAETDFCRGGVNSPSDRRPGTDAGSSGSSQTKIKFDSESPRGETPAVITVDQAILQLVAEDPFYTIAEISRQLRSLHNGRFHTGWWKVFACLRRHHMLSRRARFRHYRRARKTVA